MTRQTFSTADIFTCYNRWGKFSSNWLSFTKCLSKTYPSVMLQSMTVSRLAKQNGMWLHLTESYTCANFLWQPKSVQGKRSTDNSNPNQQVSKCQYTVIKQPNTQRYSLSAYPVTAYAKQLNNPLHKKWVRVSYTVDQNSNVLNWRKPHVFSMTGI